MEEGGWIKACRADNAARIGIISSYSSNVETGGTAARQGCMQAGSYHAEPPVGNEAHWEEQGEEVAKQQSGQAWAVKSTVGWPITIRDGARA